MGHVQKSICTRIELLCHFTRYSVLYLCTTTMRARSHLSPGKFLFCRAVRRFEDTPCYLYTYTTLYRENRLTAQVSRLTEQMISPGSCLTKCLAYVDTVQKYVTHAAKRRESPGNDRNSIRLLARGRKRTKRCLSSSTEALFMGTVYSVACPLSRELAHYSFHPSRPAPVPAIFRRFGPHYLFSFCHWRGAKVAVASALQFRFRLSSEKDYGCNGGLLLG